ncbi:BatD family protein [Bythopirellula goksoeyrii]|uniref:DUF7939 domain-containing protein n=1 Tax=Bythopirellula goksoeyrii TaxID=1400387 RepID=A0A5B9Q8I9_9BACT|nr:BatD family protein [Bythopirellula goksoeyrii]QEG35218.1 hypothetical protein Pr1d_25120 [Bythopirellula goksoeyrii]
MRLTTLALLAFCETAATCFAAVDPVVIRVPEPKAWTGERVSFFVDIRVLGSFGGATTFSLPNVPGTIILSVGNASVSSKEIEDKQWFVQTHEFSLFSQTSGKVVIPDFPLRYGKRKGFSGPATEVEGKVPSLSVEIERPPGSNSIGFLITTESLDVSETWDPKPGAAKVGSVFKRTISQHADQVLGMALPPVPNTTTEGIHVYPSNPVVKDNTERGAFEGSRTETLTYLMEKAGTYKMPAIKFVWWNPKSEQLESKELPAVTFEVAASPQSSKTTASEKHNPWAWVLVLITVCAVILAIRAGVNWIFKFYNAPERVATRRLLKACHHNNAKEAYEAWLTVPRAGTSGELNDAIQELASILYSGRTNHPWDGRKLANAFLGSKRETSSRYQAHPHLPPLNP